MDEKHQIPRKFSIYCIKNKESDLKYIGQTIQPIETRWEQHKWWAKKGLSSALIHLALKDLGEDAFEFSVLYETENMDELDQLEKEYIQNLNTLHPSGYNMTLGGNFARLAVKKPKRDAVEMIGAVTREEFKRVIDICRKYGVDHLKLGEFEISMKMGAPPSNYKKKQSEVVIADQMPTYSAEDALFWSSAGIPETN